MQCLNLIYIELGDEIVGWWGRMHPGSLILRCQMHPTNKTTEILSLSNQKTRMHLASPVLSAQWAQKRSQEDMDFRGFFLI